MFWSLCRDLKRNFEIQAVVLLVEQTNYTWVLSGYTNYIFHPNRKLLPNALFVPKKLSPHICNWKFCWREKKHACAISICLKSAEAAKLFSATSSCTSRMLIVQTNETCVKHGSLRQATYVIIAFS